MYFLPVQVTLPMTPPLMHSFHFLRIIDPTQATEPRFNIILMPAVLLSIQSSCIHFQILGYEFLILKNCNIYHVSDSMPICYRRCHNGIKYNKFSEHCSLATTSIAIIILKFQQSYFNQSGFAQ